MPVKIYCMRNPDGTPKGCAFVKFSTRTAAVAAIEALHEKCTLDVSSVPQTNYYNYYNNGWTDSRYGHGWWTRGKFMDMRCGRGL